MWNEKKVNLKSFIENLKDGLQTKINMGGTNLSIGQKQLIQLIRAMLKKTKVLIIDEASANIDLK